MKSAVENTRTRPGRRMSHRKGRLKPSQMRRNNPKRRRTKRRPTRKRSLKPTALKRRPERRLRQSPRHQKRRRRRLLKAPGRALASLVALSVALLRRPRRRNLRRRRPRVGRSDASCSVAPILSLIRISTAVSPRVHVRFSVYPFLFARHGSSWT